ncbi:MAG: DNA-3-methyladenine glycosylase [Pseudomonadales bacterium]
MGRGAPFVRGELTADFFDKDAQKLAMSLLGKVLRRRYKIDNNGGEEAIWLCAHIVETEAYYRQEKASHSSLGFSQKRKAMFMKPGTIYMYYAHGNDSLNISARGEGNAVLIKSAHPYVDDNTHPSMLSTMRGLNPGAKGQRKANDLCRGQTLLCRSLNLKVPDWNQHTFRPDEFYIEDTGYRPEAIVQCRRLGIPVGRDEELQYRFVDWGHASAATSNPLTKRGWLEGDDYTLRSNPGKL